MSERGAANRQKVNGMTSIRNNADITVGSLGLKNHRIRASWEIPGSGTVSKPAGRFNRFLWGEATEYGGDFPRKSKSNKQGKSPPLLTTVLKST
jgi:hypothetical protein